MSVESKGCSLHKADSKLSPQPDQEEHMLLFSVRQLTLWISMSKVAAFLCLSWWQFDSQYSHLKSTPSAGMATMVTSQLLCSKKCILFNIFGVVVEGLQGEIIQLIVLVVFTVR